jgi:hypothetical protein
MVICSLLLAAAIDMPTSTRKAGSPTDDSEEQARSGRESD